MGAALHLTEQDVPLVDAEVHFILDGKFYVGFNPRTRIVHRIDLFSFQVLEQCDGKKSIKDVVEWLSGRYPHEKTETISLRVMACVEAGVERHIIRIRERSGTAGTP